VEYWGFYLEDGFAASCLLSLWFCTNFEGFAGWSWIGV
jgi:hypothetical protein